MRQDATWYEGRPQPIGRRLCVTWGSSPLNKKGAEPPAQFSANFYCAQTAGCITMPLGTGVGLSPVDFVFDGDPDHSPKRGRSPSPIFVNFLLYQTAGCITMPLGMEVRLSTEDFGFDGDSAPSPKSGRSPLPSFRLISIVAKRLDGSRWHLACGPGHIVLDGKPAPLFQKGGRAPPPIFGPFLLSPNGWMNQDGTWHGGEPWSKPHCARQGPSSPTQKGGQSLLLQFLAHFYCGQMAGCIKMNAYMR